VGRVEDFRKLRLCPDNIKIPSSAICFVFRFSGIR
jgi:hypothetical protein